MDPKDIKKFFIGKMAADADQVVIAWKDRDTIGTTLSPEKLIGKTIVDYEYAETNIGKTLFIHVK